jgi:hypothetical protein
MANQSDVDAFNDAVTNVDLPGAAIALSDITQHAASVSKDAPNTLALALWADVAAFAQTFADLAQRASQGH